MNQQPESQLSFAGQQKADQLLKQWHREEYETWQLVNELVFGENMYWERKNSMEAHKKDFCPKTLEIEALKTDHNALTIHAVAHWLEKTYNVDEEAKIMPLNM